jgi:predicted hydrocarbon binding protein
VRYVNRLREKLASLYIKYWLMSKTEDLTHPGFIITKFSGENTELLLRDVFILEDLFVEIENQMTQRYGSQGAQVLYSAGKKGGYAYASLSNLTRKSQAEEKTFYDFVWDLLLFIGGTYASDVSLDIDLSNKRIEEEFKDLIICEKNGKGQIITEGGFAGIWAYLIEDPTVETIQLTCQGRGDKKCKVISQPKSQFTQQVPYSTTDLPNISYTEEYVIFNKIRKTEYASLTLDGLIEAQVAKYEDGKVLIGQMRHFEFDPHILYIIEEECARLTGAEELLFNIAFEQGKRLIQNRGNSSIQFIMDYMSAMGWGDLLILETDNKYKVASNYYPWTVYSQNSKYLLFRGLISGMISQTIGKEVKLTNLEPVQLSEFLSVVAYS